MKFHTKRGTDDVIMLWNEDIFEEVDIWVDFGINKNAVLYDAWKNKGYIPEQKDGKVRVCLKPAQAILVYFGEWNESMMADVKKSLIGLSWKES